MSLGSDKPGEPQPAPQQKDAAKSASSGPAPAEPIPPQPDRVGAVALRGRRWAELAGLFLKLGTVCFGGPAVHIAAMEDEVVRRRRWLTREEFLDLIGATNLIPGPNSTEMAIHVGYRHAGLGGLVVAGAAFILPATLITGVLAAAYVRYGAVPQVAPLLDGVKAAVLAIVVTALWRLARVAARRTDLALIGLTAAAASLAGVDEVLTLFAAALLGTLWIAGLRGRRDRDGSSTAALAWLSASAATTLEARKLATAATLVGRDAALGGASADQVVAGAAVSASAASGPVTTATATTATATASTTAAATAATATATAVATMPLWKLGLFFLKVGAVLYGSGYVLIAYLEGGLVEQYGYLTRAQLLDAVAIGQFTPGPILSTATFIGYIIAGPAGAAVATVAIFLPSFVLVLAIGPFVPRLRRSRWTAAFLDAVNVAAVGLMGAVTAKLARTTLVDAVSLLVAVVATLAVLRWNVGTAWIVLGGAAAGWLLAS